MRMKSNRMLSVFISILMIISITGCGLFTPNNVDRSNDSVKNTTSAQKETEPETEPQTEPPFEATTLNIKMIGDMLMHEGVTYSGKADDGSFNFDHLFAHIKDDIQAADVAIINQEVILGGAELGISGYPCFNTVYEVGDAIASAGFNVVLHATNHTIDMGAQGVDNCIDYWRKNHPDVGAIGINKTQEDTENIYVYEKGGIKVAVLNYTYGTNGIALPEGRGYIVNLLDEERIKKDVAKAKELANFVVVCPHWGAEYQYEPWNEYGSMYDQVNWAQLFADCGVDLVIGSHPHVIEPVEWIEGKDGNKMLCYYSVGNFVSQQDAAPRMVGAMADVTIQDDKDGNVTIVDYAVTPLVTHKAGGYQGITTYKLSDYTEELVWQNSICSQDSQFSLQFCKDLCKQVFGDLYK